MADRNFDIDAFGEIMDQFIHDNEITLVAVKGKNTDEWKIEANAPCGSVMNLYIILHALETAYIDMLNEGDKMGIGWDAVQLADALGNLLTESMKSAAEKRKEAEDVGHDQGIV